MELYVYGRSYGIIKLTGQPINRPNNYIVGCLDSCIFTDMHLSKSKILYNLDEVAQTPI